MLTLTRGRYRPITLPELRELPTPEARGPRHKPVSHAELAEAVDRMIRQQRDVYDSQMWISPSWDDAFGVLDLDEQAGPRDYIRQVLWRHDNAKKHAISISVGGQVVVCQNGLVTLSALLGSSRRKHTTGLDLQNWVADNVQQLGEILNRQDSMINQLRQTQVSNTHADRYFMAALRKGVLTPAATREADRLWRHPRYPEFEERTAWSLYNAANEGAKLLGVPRQADALQRLFNGVEYLATLN